MINFGGLQATLVTVFVIVMVIVAIGAAFKAIKGRTAQGMSIFLGSLIAVAILGLAGLGAALMTFGSSILRTLGINV